MTNDLTGSTVLITGGNSGIGRATGMSLARLGAHVVLSGRDAGRGEQAAAAIRAEGGRADFVAADLGDEASARQLARQATELGGGHVDILVNNAGIFPFGPTHEASEADFDRVFAVNVKAPFFLTAAVIPAMVEVGGGVIINLGSWIARLAVPAGAVYGATKGALETLTRTWAAEFGAQGIRVNAISPGVTFEDPDDVPDAAWPMIATTPAGRPGTPADIAAAAVYLAGDEATFVHGAVFDIDGGRSNIFRTAR